jgi:hypothetical protein
VEQLVRQVVRSWTIELGAHGDRAGIAEAVLGVAGVTSVHPSPADHELLLVDAAGDVRAQVAAAASAAGATLFHLQRQAADLDTVYHHYFGSDDGRLTAQPVA